jgi:hypothetical protein
MLFVLFFKSFFFIFLCRVRDTAALFVLFQKLERNTENNKRNEALSKGAIQCEGIE